MKKICVNSVFVLACLIFIKYNDVHGIDSNVAIVKSNKDKNEVDDILIVGTADGFIRAVDSSNNEKWILDTGGPIATSYNSEDQAYSVLPSTDGTIYIHNRDGMTKTSVKARMIAEKAPFVSSKDNLVFTGQKSSRILGVDLNNGRITHDSTSLKSPNKLTRHSNGVGGNIVSSLSSSGSGKLDPSSNTNTKSSLWLGRTDYSFRAFDRSTLREQFNITFSEVEPLSKIDNDDDSNMLTDIDDETAGDGYDDAIDGFYARHGYGRDRTVGGTAVLPMDDADFMALSATNTVFSRHSSSSSKQLPTALTALSLNRIGGGVLDRSSSLLSSLPTSLFRDSPVVSAFALQRFDSKLLKATATGENDNSSSSDGGGSKEGGNESQSQHFHIHPLRLLPSSNLDGEVEANGGSVAVHTIEGGGLLVREHSSQKSNNFATDNRNVKLLPTPDSSSSSKSNDTQFVTDAELSTPMKAPSSNIINKQPPASLSHLLGTSSSGGGSTHAALTKIKSKFSLTKLRDDLTPLPLTAASKELLLPSDDSGDINTPVVDSNDLNSDWSTAVVPLFGDSIDGYTDDDYGIDGYLDSQRFFEADGRMCVPLHYQRKRQIDGEDEEEYDPSFAGLPSCIHGHHRLLPALLAGQHKSLRLPHFIHSEKLMDPANSGGADTTAAASRLKIKSKTGVFEPLSLFRIAVLLGDLLAVIFVLAAVCVGAVYMLHQRGWLSSEWLRTHYIQLLSLLRLDEVLQLRTIASKQQLIDSVPQEQPLLNSTEVAVSVLEADGSMRVGSLVVSPHVLGYGSSGTVVFRGSLNGRAVAVKRLLTQFNWTAEREIALLIKSDGHPNVVRYFLSERRGDFVYLCLQLCSMSLRDFVTRVQQHRLAQSKNDNNSSTSNSALLMTDVLSSSLRRALQQVAEGLAHLHAQRIVHRDIKPHNILCALPELRLQPQSDSLAFDTSSGNGRKDDNNSASEGVASVTDSDGNPITTITDLFQLGDYVLKISDMGLSKQLTRDQESVSGMSFSVPNGEPSLMNTGSRGGAGGEGGMINLNPVGTIGWQAPELIALRGQHSSQPIDNHSSDAAVVAAILEGDEDITTSETSHSHHSESHHSHHPSEISGNMNSHSISVSHNSNSVVPTTATAIAAARFRPQNVDIFSLGCVFHYVLTAGSHPFGQWFEREANIMLGRCDLSPLLSVPDALDLVTRMIAREPRSRPSARQVCQHPFFWSGQRRLDFFVHLSDRLELESPDAPPVMLLESEAQSLLGRGWDRRLDPMLLEDMGKYRRYDSCSVRDLLRVVRNKRSHYNELSPAVKVAVGELPEGFISYFETRFPRLLLHCLRVTCTYYAQEKDLATYCMHISPLFKINNTVSTLSSVSTNNNMLASGSSSSKTIQVSSLITNTNSTSVMVASETMNSTETFTSITTQNTHATSTTTDSNVINTLLVKSMTSTAASLSRVFEEEVGNVNYQQQSVNTESSSSSSNCTQDDDAAVAAAVTAANAGQVIVWHGSGLADACRTVGWWRDDVSWCTQPGSRPGKQRPSHLTRSATDPKYRSRLCTHWEITQECQFKKKGKCDFAHGPLELRVKDTRRDKWASSNSSNSTTVGNSSNRSSITASSSSSGRGGGINTADVMTTAAVDLLRTSGGEDVLGAARSIEKIRATEGPHTSAVGSNGGGGVIVDQQQQQQHHHDYRNNGSASNTGRSPYQNNNFTGGGGAGRSQRSQGYIAHQRESQQQGNRS